MKTPIVTKSVIYSITLVNLVATLFQFSLPLLLANVTEWSIYLGQAYRIVLSPLVLSGFFDWLLTVWMLSSYGSSMEFAIGTAILDMRSFCRIRGLLDLAAGPEP